MVPIKLLLVLVSALCLASRTSFAQQPEIIQCSGNNQFSDVYANPGFEAAIRSYNFENGNYNNNELCVVKFISEDTPIFLKLIFNHFDLESTSSCGYDSVCLQGAKYCDSSLTGRTFVYSVPANSSFTFKFQTDSSVTRSGFQVLVYAQADTTPSIDGFYQDGCATPEYIVDPTPFFDWWGWNNNNTYEYATSDYEYATSDYESVTSDYEYATSDYEYATSDYEYATSDYEYATSDYEYATSDYEYATGDYESATSD